MQSTFGFLPAYFIIASLVRGKISKLLVYFSVI